MERAKFAIPKDQTPIFEHIFQNAMGNIIIAETTPTDASMKANTIAKVKDATDFIYLKFADGVIKKVALLAL